MEIDKYILVSKKDAKNLFGLFGKDGLIKSIKAIWYSLLFHKVSVLKTISFLSIFLFGILFIALKAKIEPSDITRDYNGVFNNEPYIAFLSFLGIFFWCAALTVCWFSWYLLTDYRENERLGIFFWWSGLITTFLALDDLFELHEVVFPRLFGLPEYSMYVVYLVCLTIYIFKFYKLLFNQNVIFIFLAYSALAISMFLDTIKIPIRFETYTEDCFKFIGIFFWALYYIKFAYYEITNTIKK